MECKKPSTIIIDGLSGVGKSTVASLFGNELKCPVVHCDELLYNSIIEMPSEMERLFGERPQENEHGLTYLSRVYKNWNVTQNQRLFNETRDCVEEQCEQIKTDLINQGTVRQKLSKAIINPLQNPSRIVYEYLTSSKFKRFWQDADLRIIVDSDPFIRAPLLIDRVSQEEGLYNPDFPRIQDKSFWPEIRNAKDVSLYLFNHYDKSLKYNVENLCSKFFACDRTL